jgi:hypothetical protein
VTTLKAHDPSNRARRCVHRSNMDQRSARAPLGEKSFLFLPLALSHNLSVEPLVRTLGSASCSSAFAPPASIFSTTFSISIPIANILGRKERPFATGEISIPEGLLASFILLSAALGLGFLFDAQFGVALLGYAVLTMLYSFYFKKIALLDVFVLSSFYSFRLLAGALISGTPLSQWFMAFSLCFLPQSSDGKTLLGVTPCQ